MKTLLLVSVLALFLPNLAVAQAKVDASREPRPVLYNFIPGAATKLDHTAGKAYADKFKVVEITEKDDFKDARLKGDFYSIDDPRSMRVWQVPGRVEVNYLVSPEGKVTDVRVLESTNPLFAKSMVARVRARRFFPARYRGLPVFSLRAASQEFGRSSRAGLGFGQDGLGIMGYRDR